MRRFVFLRPPASSIDEQKALLADKRGPRQPTAHRLGLLHTSVGRGTFPGFESLSRPPQGEDSLGE